MTDRDASVERLIQLWQAGDLTLSEGTVSHVDHTTIQVTYEGTDGTLSTTYSLAEELTHRSDGEKTHQRFNILAEQ